MRTLHTLTRGRAGPLRAGLAVLTVAALATVTACTTSSGTRRRRRRGLEGRGRR